VHRRFPDGVPQLSATEEMKVSDERVPKLLRMIEAVQSRLAEERLQSEDVRKAVPLLRARLRLADQESCLSILGLGAAFCACCCCVFDYMN
jgi:hypothetical protein